MTQSLSDSCNELKIDNSAELHLEKGQYSSDSHLLMLLFDVPFINGLVDFSPIKVVHDINTLSSMSFSQAQAVVVVRELERYSSCDLNTFVDCVERNQLQVFTVSSANLKLLSQYGLHHPNDILPLPLRIKEPSDFIQRVKTANRRIECDLDSTRLPLNHSLLLPSQSVTADGFDSNQNSCTKSADQKLSWVQRIRYPLAVSKRHVKNCLQELRTCEPADKNGRAEVALSGLQQTQLVQIRLYPVELQGTVFLAVFDTFDYGSDWSQLVTAFCTAMRNNKDATLVLWVTGKVEEHYKADLHHLLCTVSPFQCSTVLFLGELTTEELHNLLSATNFLLNVEMYRGLRLDVLAAAACGIPVISAANSSVDLFNQFLICHCLETDEQLAAADRSADPVYRTRHRRVVWEDLQEQIATAYQLAKNKQAYKDAQLMQVKRFKQLKEQSFSDHNC